MSKRRPHEQVAGDVARGLASRAKISGPSPFSRPKREDVRALLLTSAAEVFLDEGYERASLARIATRAGFTKGAIYSNFGSKPELFLAAWDAHVRARQKNAIEELARTAAHTQSIDTLLDSLSRELVALIPTLGPWEILLAQIRQLARTDTEVSSLYTQIFAERLEGILDALRGHELLADKNDSTLRIFAIALVSLMNVLCLERAAQPEQINDDEAASLFRYCLEGALR